MSKLDIMKKYGLVGCLNDSGITSQNYKERLYGQKWISVEDELPDRDDTVIVFLSNGKQAMVKYTKAWGNEGALILSGLDFVGCSETVTHWMELPEPPEEDEKT